MQDATDNVYAFYRMDRARLSGACGTEDDLCNCLYIAALKLRLGMRTHI
jgi:hypothetical protein